MRKPASMKKTLLGLCLCISVLGGIVPSFAAQRIKDVASVQGVRANQLVGYGLVVGLNGTGDDAKAPYLAQSMTSMLGQLGVNIPAGTDLKSKNVAAVMITANLPAFVKPGQTIDVTVSSIGNAKSLNGGTLIMTPLKGADGQVYAIAQGNIVSGLSVGTAGGGANVQQGHSTAGRIPAGGTVERAVAAPLGQGDFVHLELTSSDFTTTNRMVQAINRAFGDDTARALDGRMVQVRAPRDSNERVAFLAKLENLSLAGESQNAPRVIFNARTGSVVINQKVTLEDCAISHGTLTVVVSSEPSAVTVGPDGKKIDTIAERNAKVDVIADKGTGKVTKVNRGANLNDVIRSLNAIGATPQDLLAILQAMKAAGALKAELEVI